jgi:TM2 domain-containing membrane protein YozV
MIKQEEKMENNNVNFQNTQNNGQEIAASEKSWLTTLLLCIFLGGLGIHRFYSGHIGLGILYLLTGGVFGIGWLVDLIMIATKSYKDKEKKPIINN